MPRPEPGKGVAIGHVEGRPRVTPSPHTSSLNKSRGWFVCVDQAHRPSAGRLAATASSSTGKNTCVLINYKVEGSASLLPNTLIKTPTKLTNSFDHI